jgi:hypothetical protein
MTGGSRYSGFISLPFFFAILPRGSIRNEIEGDELDKIINIDYEI